MNWRLWIQNVYQNCYCLLTFAWCNIYIDRNSGNLAEMKHENIAYQDFESHRFQIIFYFEWIFFRFQITDINQLLGRLDMKWVKSTAKIGFFSPNTWNHWICTQYCYKCEKRCDTIYGNWYFLPHLLWKITEGVERIHKKLRKKQNKQQKKKKQINANRIHKKK